MMYKLRNQFHKKLYDLLCNGVLSTPPLPSVDDGTVILSGVGKMDLVMYLVAIKSFYHEFGRGRIVLLVPDDFPDDKLRVLIKHVNPLKVIRDGEVRLGNCPKGGTWERIVSIMDLIRDYYVIQLDADTVTLKDVAEVRKCADTNRSFTIGTWPNQQIEPMSVSCERIKKVEGTHVQHLAEKNFDRLRNYKDCRYVRGQSSFAGFAKGSFSHGKLEEFSQNMVQILGADKWNEWGSESVASNYVVANSDNSVVLPYPRYGRYLDGDGLNSDSAFVHFEGTNRFKGGVYIQKSREVIARLGGR